MQTDSFIFVAYVVYLNTVKASEIRIQWIVQNCKALIWKVCELRNTVELDSYYDKNLRF